MQAPTAVPRAHLSAAGVVALLRAPDVTVSAYGATVLDDLNAPVGELTTTDPITGRETGALGAATVSWDGAADIHRSVDLTIAAELAWDRTRLRLWQTLTSETAAVSATFHRGVFVITRPAAVADNTSTVEHTCKGWDLLHRLRGPVGTTWSTRWQETGQTTTVAAEVRRLLVAARWRSPFVLPPESEAQLLPEPMVWPAADGASWLLVLVELLRAGGFTGPWVDESGTGRVDPIVALEERPVEWTLDATSPDTVLGPVRTRTRDLALVPNRWVFVNTSIEREPVNGDGLYLPPDNDSTGPTSIAARDLVLSARIEFEAADQGALIALGDERRASDMRAAGVRDVTTAALPLMGHRDLHAVIDPAHGDPVRALATRWVEDLTGAADTQLTLEEVP